MKQEIEQARISGFYQATVEGRLEWLLPLPEHENYIGRGRNFFGDEVDGMVIERPTYVVCLDCGAIHRYSTPARFGDWGFRHGSGYCGDQSVMDEETASEEDDEEEAGG